MRKILGLRLLVLGLLLTSCGDPFPTRNPEEALKVVATTGMLYDAIVNIGGDVLDVSVLMQPGVDPHLFKVSYSNLNTLTEADLIIYNGLHLEGKMNDIFSKLSRVKSVYAAAENIPKSRLRLLEESSESYDPHVWFDVRLWAEVVAGISLKLQEIDPAHALHFQHNTTAYLQQLDTLDKWVRKEVALIPKNQRRLITTHDAFGYFGAAYDFELVSLQGISTLSEFGLRDISELIAYIRLHDISAVFVEASVAPKALEAVVEGSKKKGKKIKIGGNLYADSMGASHTPEGTYIGMIRANVQTLRTHLQ